MAGSVEIYVRYPGAAQTLAREVAEELDLMRYFRSGSGYLLPVEARKWIGEEGWGHLRLDRADPDIVDGTAFEAYEYELSLDYRGAREQLGRAVFRRLARLDLPLAYGTEMYIFADFLPGRGHRDFSPQTDAEEPGRALWFEPRMHGDPAPARRREAGTVRLRDSPSAPTAGAVTVFETGGLLQAVPVADGRWIRPVAAMRAEIGARSVGELVEVALRTKVRFARDDRAEILPSLANAMRLSTEDFVRAACCVELRLEGDELAAIARAPRPGGPSSAAPGPVVEELARRLPAASGPEALGELVLDLLAALRSQVPS